MEQPWKEPTTIEIKHFMDPAEPGDGLRIWVEPIDLVRDLREWCAVDCSLTNIAPSVELRDWYEQHPSEYEEFRGRYHEHLARGPHRRHLHRLAVAAGGRDTLTLLHDGDDPERNTATALAEFLVELAGWRLD